MIILHFIIRWRLFVNLFFIGMLFGASPFLKAVTIAIIDTGFCSHNSPEVTYFDATHSNISSFDCHKVAPESPRLHGEHVLRVIKSTALMNHKLSFILITAYDKNGKTDLSYIKESFKFLKDKRYDFVVMAMGVPIKNNDVDFLFEEDKIYFLSAGRTSPFIKKTDLLFPQSKAHFNYTILVGNLIEKLGPDPGLMNKDLIKLYTKGDDGTTKNAFFNGSSFSVAYATGYFLAHCPFINKAQFLTCFQQEKEKLK